MFRPLRLLIVDAVIRRVGRWRAPLEKISRPLKSPRWRTGLLLLCFVGAVVGGSVLATKPVSAATGGPYQFTDAKTITGNGQTFTSTGGSTFTAIITCHPAREVGEDIYTVTVGAKITGATGGYNGKISTAHSGISCGNTALSGAITISDPNGVGPGGGSTGTPTTGQGGTGNSTPSCENNGFSLAWLFCPLIEGLAKAVDGIYGKFIQPLLQTPPLNVSNSGNDPVHTYAIWSNFRIYGDVFLILALLVIVFGQSIGGGMLDAYTAKKVLPRLVIAAIAINLSLYIVALAIDLTNVIGVGIQNLIETPFKQPNGGWTFNLGGAGGQAADGIGLAALVGGGIWAAFAGSALLYFLFTFVLIPAFFVFLAILATVIIRQALIIFLVFTSPVAFALYCLPNTEQYFHKWWKLLLETLLVYPIIAIVFALSNVLSVVILDTSTGLEKTIGTFLSIAALIAPLVLIPYSFRLAGGAIGKAHDVLTDYGKRGHQAILGNPNDPNSKRNIARYKLGDRNTQMRENAVRSGKSENAGFVRRRFGSAMNFGNLQAKRSMYNKQRGEQLEGQIATGDDSNIRDMFIAYDEQKGEWYRRMDMHKNDDGTLSAEDGASSVYKNYATGASAHKKAMSLYGGDKSAFQSGLYYEWKKTSFSPSAMDNIGDQYGEILQEHGFNTSEGTEAMKAIGFRHQGQTLATKYSGFKEDPNTGKWGWTHDRVGMAREIGLNVGLGQMTQQDVTTYEELGKGYQDIGALLAANSGAQDHEIIVQKDKATGKLAPGMGQYFEYEGKTAGQLRDAQDRIRRISDSVSPGTTSTGGVAPVTLGPDAGGAPAGGGAAAPQPYGAGVSYAPVDVQASAKRLKETVQAVDTHYGFSGPPPTAPTPHPPNRN